MSFHFQNGIPADSYFGTIDGITVHWGSGAFNTLNDDADIYKVKPSELKLVTENVAVAGSFHNTTTRSTFAGRERKAKPDACHCSFTLKPGNIKAHIYVVNLEEPLEGMKVVGESIVGRHGKTRDLTLSWGDLPAFKF
ncbi:hypothetical protein N7540_000380 [Penicillium herquei]|nr:hypothetical protein N7540_000380 [Penicillium herquei]